MNKKKKFGFEIMVNLNALRPHRRRRVRLPGPGPPYQHGLAYDVARVRASGARRSPCTHAHARVRSSRLRGRVTDGLCASVLPGRWSLRHRMRATQADAVR